MGGCAAWLNFVGLESTDHGQLSLVYRTCILIPGHIYIGSSSSLITLPCSIIAPAKS